MVRVQGPLLKPRTVGDVLIVEYHQAYCRDSGKVDSTNALANGVPDPVGQPIKDNGDGTFTFIIATDEASATGLLIHDKPLEAVGAGGAFAQTLPVLARGPAVVNESALPTNDVDGNALNWTTIKAQLPDIVFRTEPTKQTVMTQEGE